MGDLKHFAPAYMYIYVYILYIGVLQRRTFFVDSNVAVIYAQDKLPQGIGMKSYRTWHIFPSTRVLVGFFENVTHLQTETSLSSRGTFQVCRNSVGGFWGPGLLPTWRIIPCSKWFITPIYKPTTSVRGFSITIVANVFT